MTAEIAETGSEENVLLRADKGGVAILTLNRPLAFNALSLDLIQALQAALDSLADDEETRVIVLAASGRAFSTGHDLKEMRQHPDLEYYRNLFAASGRMMTTMTHLPQPVIARVHGIAASAGCQLVANCDLAVASHEARFATNGISNGLFCSTPSVPLSRNVSRKHAFDMLFTGDFVDAETAREYGLVNRVVAADQLDVAVAEYAAKIMSKSRVAVASGKRMFYEQLRKPLDEAYAYAGNVMARDMMTEDAAEGFDAFIEKRPPVWKHR